MSDFGDSPAASVKVTFSDRQLIAPVLERVVSVAAVQAQMPVDRLVNALAAVDALGDASSRTLPDGNDVAFSIDIAPGRLLLAINGLQDGQVEGVLQATQLAEIGDVLARVAESVDVLPEPHGRSLVVTLR
jgi:hypothetical protein